MKIAISCGGTGGHVFPGLAVGKVLRNRGHEVTLWLGGRGVEDASVEGWQGGIVRVPAKGFAGGPLRWIGTAFSLVRAWWICRQKMKRDRPDAVLAMGSYASIGPGMAASSLGIPLILHEGNVIPGRATKFLASRSQVMAISFEQAREHIEHDNIINTGFPVRADLESFFADGVIEPQVPVVLVTGGSQGARKLNELVTAAICDLAGQGANLQVVHLTGREDEEKVRQRYEAAGLRNVVFPFLQEIGSAYAAADLAITRAGAATCAELSAFALPSLLVPLPTAIHGHQLGNARALESESAADVIEEKDLTVEWLASYIRSTLQNKKKLTLMMKALQERSPLHAASRIADLVEKA